MKIIITGATGLVGEGVLRVCLENPLVTDVVSISRKPLSFQHAKLKELILSDFSTIDTHIDALKDFDACFFCAGVSSIGENEESFTRKTYDFVVPFAQSLANAIPTLTFIYVSGSGTDSTEQGKVMWARVKGKTENAVLNMPFKAAYCFRPSFMRPLKSQTNVRPIFRIIDFLAPIWYLILPNWICHMQEVGDAMLHCVDKGYEKPILEVPDIKKRARF